MSSLAPDPSGEVSPIREALGVIRRRRWIVVAVTVVSVAATLAVSLTRAPTYEARTELLIQSLQAVSDLTGADGGAGTATDQRVIVSDRVRDRVAADLGLAVDDARLTSVRVAGIANTRIVEIIATDSDPVTAARIADGFAAAYLADRVDRTFDRIEQARAALTTEIEDLERQIVELDRQLMLAQEQGGVLPAPVPPVLDPDAPAADAGTGVGAGGAAGGATGDAATDGGLVTEPDEPVTAGSLQLDRDLLFDNLTTLIARRDALVSDPANLTEGGTVLRPAVVPTDPIAPRPLRDGLLALVLGLTLGIALAYLRDHLDDVVRDDQDVRRATAGIPILGRVPRWDHVGAATEGVTSLLEPSSVAAETYRELSANVRFLTVPRRGGSVPDSPSERQRGTSILVASATAGNGKSATAANLAIAAARAGQRVVLVDADLRRPRLARQFGLPRGSGLSDVVADPSSVLSHLVKVGVPNLRFISAGRIPPNPAELLASRGMVELHEALIEVADLVIYDTPAVLAVPDALELGRVTDLALFVVRHGESTRREIGAALERLEQVGIAVSGVVINGIDTRADAYYYYYTYYYRSGYADRQRTERPLPEVGPFDATDRTPVTVEDQRAGRAGRSREATRRAGGGRRGFLR